MPTNFRSGARLSIWLFTGAVGLMLLCQAFFGLLQLSSLETKLRTGVLTTADTAAASLADDLSMGLRLGKHLRNFYNLRNLLLDAHKTFPMAHDICVTDAAGNLVESVPGAYAGQTLVPIDNHILNRAPGAGLRTGADDLYYADKPLLGRGNVVQGHVLIRLKASVLEERITPAIMVIVRNILLVMAATVAASLLILRFVPFFSAHGALIRKRIYLSFGILFAVVLLASSIGNHRAFRQEYLSIAMDNSRTMGQTLRETLHRTIGKGVPLSLLKAVEEYFETAAAKTAGSVLIELYGPDGKPAFSSRRAFSGEAVVPGSASDAGFTDAANPEGAGVWVLRTSLSQKVFDDAVREDILNSAGFCVISLTLLFELLLLFCLFLERRTQEPVRDGAADSERYNTMLRAVFFLFMLALDMSITFIPLRMAELPSDFLGLPRDAAMGLPVSAEVAMAGICIFLTGRWVSRYGAALPMSIGFTLAAMGYLASALASDPLGFILARAVAGAGYGTSIMAAQAYVFKSGGLAGLFAGVFAGSLCGGAAGSMIAEKLGFSAAFYASSIMMLLLAALPYALLRRGDTARASGPSPQAGQAGKTGCMRILKAMGNGQFLALSLFALVPATFVVMGFTKYFMPVYLNRAAVAQADIGRVYMVYCLVLIYLGPPLGKLALRARRKATGVAAGCFLGALSILPLAVFDSLWATVFCAFILGLATAINIPAHAEYLLRLDITAQLGGNQALGLLNVVERVGQAAAPIAIGLFMSAFPVQDIALWGGLFLFLLAGAFYVTKVQE